MILYQVTYDLRLQDNLALNAAIRAAYDSQEPLVAAWFITPSFQRASTNRQNYLLHELTIYQKSLAGLGIHLHLLSVSILDFISQLKLIGVSAIYKTDFWGLEEQNFDQQITHHFKLITFEQGQLFEESDLPFKVAQTPEVFTQFRKLVENRVMIKKPHELERYPIKSDAVTPWQDWTLSFDDKKINCYWQGGEFQAWQHLQKYIWQEQSILHYKKTRNGLIKFSDSTKLSPFLALGVLSPRQIYFEIKKFEQQVTANESTYWVYFELLWREYFRWIAKKWGAKFYTGMHPIAVCPQPSQTHWEQWCKGQTTDDFVNANMRELNATGWMSNRGRQNVASFLIHQFKLPWIWGAHYFEQQLLDYDPFSNWGNWSYLAGVGQDPRQRIFNTQKQADQYDPHGDYRRLWS